MEQLQLLDRKVFQMINTGWSNSLFDAVMPVLTDLHRTALGPWILILFFLIWVGFERQKAALPILLTVLAIGLSDATCHHILKTVFERQRPVNSNEFSVVLRSEPHSGYSFPSNHASNVFAAARALSVFLPTFVHVFYGLAVTVALSRVYVGVHFPSDILAGALWGWLLAGIILRIYRRLRSALDSSHGKSSSRWS